MSWGSIRGHDEIVEQLRTALESGRFPHALLFVGPEGIGKKLFAIRLAQSLLCQKRTPELLDPCGACHGCVQVQGGTHPDLLMAAKPEDRLEFPIAPIRQLCMDLGLKPMNGDRRIAIIDDADDFNDEAANAFLKTLEEPPSGALLILIGTSPELQLDTILSRCRVVPFRALSEGDLMQVLLDREVAKTPAEAERLAKLAEGSVRRAIGMSDASFSAFRRELIDIVGHANGFDAPGLARRIDAYVKDAGKDAGPKRQRACLAFGELARLFRAVLWQTAGVEPPASDPRDRQAIHNLAQRLEPEDVFILADRCITADYQVNRMLYLPSVLDALTHDLGKRINARR